MICAPPARSGGDLEAASRLQNAVSRQFRGASHAGATSKPALPRTRDNIGTHSVSYMSPQRAMHPQFRLPFCVRLLMVL